MKIDTSLTPLANLLAVVNSANGLDLTEADVSVGAPLVQAGAGNHNTVVTLSSQADGRYAGAVDVSYYRLALSEGTVAPAVVYFNDASTLDSVLSDIAVAYNLVKTEISLVETQLPVHGANGTVTVQVNLGSLLYQGGNLTVTVAWGKPALASVVTTTDLPGFDPAVAAPADAPAAPAAA